MARTWSASRRGPALLWPTRPLVCELVDDGFSSEAPSQDRELYQPARYGNRRAPVLTSWASGAEVPDLGIDVAGEAAPQRMFTPLGGRHCVSGEVTPDAAEHSTGPLTRPGSEIGLSTPSGHRVRRTLPWSGVSPLWVSRQTKPRSP